MNKMKLILLEVFSMISLNACSQNENILRYNEFRNAVISDVFISSPIKENKKIEDCYTLAIDFPAAYEFLGYCGISVVCDYDSTLFVDALNLLEKNNIGKYNDNDKCKLLITDSTTAICKKSDTIYYPIYNIYSTLRNGRADVLSKSDIEYYVIDCKEGLYLKSYDFEENPKILPLQFLNRTFQHGFSSGATVDENKRRIVYWILIW